MSNKPQRIITTGLTGVAAIKTATGQALPLVVLTDVSVDQSFEYKSVEDPNGTMPLQTDLVGEKTTVKAKCGATQADLLAALTNGTLTVGGVAYTSETPALVDHTQTLTHAAAFVEDCGVVMPDGTPGKPVAGAPATASEYSITAGVVTYHATVTTAPTVNYGYTDPAAITVSKSRGTPGEAKTLSAVFAAKNGKKALKFYALRVSKVGQDDKAKQGSTLDVDFEAQPDANDKVCDIVLKP